MSSKILLNRSLVPGTCLVRLSGVLNEDIDRKDIAQISESVVVFDLEGVQRITSFGVREWITALKECQSESYFFVNCHPAIISQFNMVANFGGQGQLVTLYAPYLCSSCDKEIEVLLDLRVQHQNIIAGKLPTTICPSCQEEADFDDVPETYFSYISTQAPPQVPPLATKLIESLREKFSIQKEVLDNVTGVWLSGPLDQSAHFKRLADSLEGYTVVVTAAITDITAEGLDRFKRLTATPEAKVFLARVPLALASHLLVPKNILGKANLISLQVVFTCANCKRNFDLEAEHSFISRRPNFGESTCPHCEKKTVLQQVQHPQAWQILQQAKSAILQQVPQEVSDYLKKRPETILTDPISEFPIVSSSSSLQAISAIDRTLVVNPPSSGKHQALSSKNLSPVIVSGGSTTPNQRICSLCRNSYPSGLNTCPKDGTPLDPSKNVVGLDPLLNKQAGSYRLVATLGEGGMGRVYTATHASLGKKVAVKVLHHQYATSPSLVERFFEEARAASQLGHEHIVDIHDFGVLDGIGLPYITMEFLNGQSLEALLKKQPIMPPQIALSITIQLLDALGAAHAIGIIHRDIKPDNIYIIERKNEKNFVKLLDFGVAKLTIDSPVNTQNSKPLTQVGALIGTPRYMSPEQAEGNSKNLDRRADLYSVGIILYEMLCGRPPFDGEQFSELVLAHLSSPPPPPKSINPKLSQNLESIILKAMAKKREQRFQSAEEMAQTLQNALNEETKAPSTVKETPAQPLVLPEVQPKDVTKSPKISPILIPPKTSPILIIALISFILGAMIMIMMSLSK